MQTFTVVYVRPRFARPLRFTTQAASRAQALDNFYCEGPQGVITMLLGCYAGRV